MAYLQGMNNRQLPRSILPCLLGVFFFYCLLSGEAQAQRLPFRYYGPSEGLGSSVVNALLEDSRGYLWVGTNSGGISRFDGYEFKTYSIREGLTDVMVNAIFEDHLGTLWVGTDGGGLCWFDGLRFHATRPQDSLNSLTIFSITETSDKQLMVGTNDGLYIRENTSFKLVKLGNEDLYTPISYLYAGLKKTYILTIEGKIYSYFAMKTSPINLEQRIALSIVADNKEENIFVGTSLGLEKIPLNKTPKRIYDFNILNKGVNFLTWESNNRLWVACSLGIVVINTQNDIIEKKIEMNNGLRTPNVRILLWDQTKTLWMGLGNGEGLAQLQSSYFSYWNKSDGMSNNEVKFVQPDNNGNVWIATETGLDKLHKGTIVNFNYNNGLPSDFIRGIHLDNQNNLWTMGKGGLGRLKGNYFEKQNCRSGMPSENLICMTNGNRDTLYIGTREEGVLIGSNNKWKTLLTAEQTFYQVIYDIVFDSLSGIWMATPIGLLNYYKGKITLYDKLKGLEDIFINTLLMEPTGRLWLATNSNVSYIDTRLKKKAITTPLWSTQIPLKVPLQLLKRDEHLYIGGANGFINVNLKDNTWRHFTDRDGFSLVETSQNAIAEDKEGNIWIGSVKGVMKYRAAEDLPLNVVPKVWILDYKINSETFNILPHYLGKSLYKSFPIILDYFQNNLQFSFVGIYLVAPEKLVYYYRLMGNDSVWKNIGNQRTINFTNLPDGEYQLEVKVLSRDGVWSEKPAVLTFTITPPFWKEWWFYLIYPLILFGVVRAIVSLRTAALVSRKKELEEEVHKNTIQIKEELTKNELLNQNLLETNRHITDSIEYAKLLQGALLPDLLGFYNILPESFVLYKPKDIISGDFYWYNQKGDILYIAAVDCTGHGVPGAFMSVLGNNLLNQILSQYEDVNPEVVLKLLSASVVDALRQHEQRVVAKDGMEVALVRINLVTLEVEFSGANRPLYYFKAGKLMEIKGTKQPIGGELMVESSFFSITKIELSPGDSFYLTSDGFADQFGGAKGRKYKTGKLKEYLTSIQHLPMAEQGKRLEQEFETWKGSYKQMDDVLIIGVSLAHAETFQPKLFEQ
jgi:ligand-binding sensor domain-containing protein/serine phosphatase RsbU (regulator of sigma subunit)